MASSIKVTELRSQKWRRKINPTDIFSFLGIPELDVPSLDPFFVDFQSNNYRVGDVTGQIVTKNVKSYGLSKTRFLSVKPHHGKGRFSLEVDSEMSKVFVEGDYKAEGAVGSFKVGGKGNNLFPDRAKIMRIS